MQKLNYRNTTKQESIYGWYPPAKVENKRNDDPKEIYANVGSRPPKDQSYCDAEVLYAYHQSIKPSELIYKPKQTVDEALKPPWSLNLKTTGEFSENAEKTIPEAFAARRTHSAPAVRNVPTHRIILKIPTPQLHNLFDGEAEEYFDNNDNMSCHSEVIVEKQPLQFAELLPPEQYKLLNMNDNSEVIITNSSSNIEQKLQELDEHKKQQEAVKAEQEQLFKRVTIATNHGKKPLVNDNNSARLIQRPKTCSSSFRRTQSSASIQRSQTSLNKDRPKTSIVKTRATSVPNAQDHEALKIDTTTAVKTEDSITDKFNNTSTSLHQLITSHANNEQQTTQFHFNHFYNSKNNSHSPKPPQSPQPQQQQHGEQTVIYVDPSWVDNYLKTKHRLQRNDIRAVEGNWKDQIINRSKYLQRRPSYFVKVNLDKLKPDPPPPEVHYKASDTFFYNTLPTRKMTFTVDPHFISENLNVKKLELQNRPPSSNGTNNGPIRYRRDYAFAY